MVTRRVAHGSAFGVESRQFAGRGAVTFAPNGAFRAASEP